jgi:hypothetical protein
MLVEAAYGQASFFHDVADTNPVNAVLAETTCGDLHNPLMRGQFVSL